MIADKLVPSFYLVQLRGKAIQALISGEFGIQDLTVASSKFDNDLAAMSSMQATIKHIIDGQTFSLDGCSEKMEYNPDFYPHLSPEKEEDFAEIADEDPSVVSITKKFDETGDFIQSRWTIEGPNFSIEGKIGALPDEYLQLKKYERIQQQTIEVTPAKRALLQ
jgi:hypothetical protein